MKKCIIFGLGIIMALSFAACSGESGEREDDSGLRFVGAHKGDAYGLMDAQGNFVQEEGLQEMPGLTVNGMCYLRKTYGPIDLYTVDGNGKMSKVMMNLQDCGYMADGLVPTVRMGGHIVYRDRSGQPKFKLDSVGGAEVRMAGSHFSEGISWFKDENGRIGIINNKGKVMAMACNEPTWRIPASARSGMIIIPSGENDNFVLNLNGKKLFEIKNAQQTVIKNDTIFAARIDKSDGSEKLILDRYNLKGEFIDSSDKMPRLGYDYISGASNLEEMIHGCNKLDYWMAPCSWNESLGIDRMLGQQSMAESILFMVFVVYNCPFDLNPFSTAVKEHDIQISMLYSPAVICYPKPYYPGTTSADGYFVPSERVLLIDGAADCSMDFLTFNMLGDLTVKPYMQERMSYDIDSLGNKVNEHLEKHVYLMCSHYGVQKRLNSYNATTQDGYYVAKYYMKHPDYKVENNLRLPEDAAEAKSKRDSERDLPRFDDSDVAKYPPKGNR